MHCQQISLCVANGTLENRTSTVVQIIRVGDIYFEVESSAIGDLDEVEPINVTIIHPLDRRLGKAVQQAIEKAAEKAHLTLT